MSDMNYPAEEYRQDLYAIISDASKDAMGSRMRYDVSTMSTNELRELVDYWIRAAEASIEMEAREEARRVESFWALVDKTIAMGAKTRETAIRWIFEGEMAQSIMAEEYGTDLASGSARSYFCYTMGLPYRWAHDGTLYADDVLEDSELEYFDA